MTGTIPGLPSGARGPRCEVVSRFVDDDTVSRSYPFLPVESETSDRPPSPYVEKDTRTWTVPKEGDDRRTTS